MKSHGGQCRCSGARKAYIKGLLTCEEAKCCTATLGLYRTKCLITILFKPHAEKYAFSKPAVGRSYHVPGPYQAYHILAQCRSFHTTSFLADMTWTEYGARTVVSNAAQGCMPGRVLAELDIIMGVLLRF